MFSVSFLSAKGTIKRSLPSSTGRGLPPCPCQVAQCFSARSPSWKFPTKMASRADTLETKKLLRCVWKEGLLEYYIALYNYVPHFFHLNWKNDDKPLSGTVFFCLHTWLVNGPHSYQTMLLLADLSKCTVLKDQLLVTAIQINYQGIGWEPQW
jgi:hypothetical protein